MMKLKRAPAQFLDFDQPLSTDNETVIHATPEAIFAALDLASPRNALRQRGFTIEANRSQTRFTLTDPRMPEETLILEVISRSPPREYAVRMSTVSHTGTEPEKQTTRVFGIEQRVDRACQVTLSEVTSFSTPLSRDRYVLERASQGFSVFRTLARLKLQVELGLDAATNG